jgi:hypothetical protein
MILLSNVRLSFPQLVEPRASTLNPTAPKKYSADFILQPNDPAFAQFYAEVQKLAAEKWGDKAAQVLAMIQSDRKLRCFGSGTEKVNKKTFTPYSGYEGGVFISANRDQMPQMIEANGKPVEAGNTMAYQMLARKLYGGCYVNAAINPWLQDNTAGRGVRCDLVAIQFSKDGEPFGEAAADASALFGAVAAAPAAAAAPSFLMPTPPFLQQ